MADLKGLIKLRRNTVEEKQKVLGEIYRQMEAIENQKKDLQDKLKRERAALDENMDIEARSYFGRFQDVVNAKIENLTAQANTLEGKLQIAQEDVRAAFAEQKRVEIVHDRRLEEERQAINNKESQELDAIGIEGFRRNEE